MYALAPIFQQAGTLPAKSLFKISHNRAKQVAV